MAPLRRFAQWGSSMSSSPEPQETYADDQPRPSWLSLRVGVPIAVILIGVALGSLWERQFRVLASADVKLGRQSFRLQLKDDRGWLNGCAYSSEGEYFVQRLAPLDRSLDPDQRQAPLTRNDIRKARLFVDARRREARFILPQATIAFDGRRFSVSATPREQP